MSEITTTVSLTNEELILLDGKCRESIQKDVNKALAEVRILSAFESHEGLTPAQVKLATRIAAYALENGIIETSFIHVLGMSCQCCGKATRYAAYKRSSYNHRKGDPNYDKPIYVQGIHLPRAFACWECWKGMKEPIVSYLDEHGAEISATILERDQKSRWRKSPNMECTECGWNGHEYQLGQIYTGFRYSRCVCPSCGFKDTSLFLTKIKKTSGFVMIDTKKKAEATAE